MPILVRPVREQLEHDRVIRQLQAKWKRKFDVTTNVGDEKNAAVRSGTITLYPDLVLAEGRRVAAVIEVETNESVNHLEAMAQWAHLGRSRVPFHLYVPAGSVEMARRLAEEQQVAFAEIWSYHAVGEQMRFVLVHRAPAPPKPVTRAASRPATPRKPAAAAARAGAGRGARSASRNAARTKKAPARAVRRK